jgi:hypothetical protein
MRANEAFRKEVRLLYDVGGGGEDDDGEDANNDAPRVTAFSLLRAAALMTAALDEPQLSYEREILPAVAAASSAAERRLLRPAAGALSPLLRRSRRPETEQLERVASAVGAALRLDCGLRENVADPHDPRNHLLDRAVLRTLSSSSSSSCCCSLTGPTIAAVLFAEVARALGAGVALAGTQDRPLLRLFDRQAAESAPTSADVAMGHGAASAWAETPSSPSSPSSSSAAAMMTPVLPPPSVIVDPLAALLPQEGDEADDDNGDHRTSLPAAENAFLYAWLPDAGAWVPTAALDRPVTRPSEPPRAWPTLEPSEAPPLATRAALHAALAAVKRSHAASGRFEDALAACRLARAVDPLDADELRDEGALLVGAGRHGEGALRLREYLAVAPGECKDRAWVEAEVARAEALVELESRKAARARANAEEEGGGGDDA